MGKLDSYYIKYLESHTGQKSVYGESPEDFVERLTYEDFKLPYSSVLFLDERCSFLEAILLRSAKA